MLHLEQDAEDRVRPTRFCIHLRTADLSLQISLREKVQQLLRVCRFLMVKVDANISSLSV